MADSPFRTGTKVRQGVDGESWGGMEEKVRGTRVQEMTS